MLNWGRKLRGPSCLEYARRFHYTLMGCCSPVFSRCKCNDIEGLRYGAEARCAPPAFLADISVEPASNPHTIQGVFTARANFLSRSAWYESEVCTVSFRTSAGSAGRCLALHFTAVAADVRFSRLPRGHGFRCCPQTQVERMMLSLRTQGGGCERVRLKGDRGD